MSQSGTVLLTVVSSSRIRCQRQETIQLMLRKKQESKGLPITTRPPILQPHWPALVEEQLPLTQAQLAMNI